MWKILLVEDEPFVRRSIRNAIPWEEHGFTIAGEASHGQEALEKMKELDPDIVVTDIFMPYMDGIELLKTARAEGSEARFIMLTCAGEFEYARAALEHGASGYILKLSMEDDQLIGALGKAKAELDKIARQQERALWDSIGSRIGYLWRDMLGKELSGYEREKLEELKRHGWNGGRLTIATALSGSEPFGCERFCALLGVSPGNGELVHSFAHMGQTTLFIRWSGGAQPELLKLPDRQLPVICRSASGEEIEAKWLANLRWLDRFYYSRPTGGGAETDGAEWNMPGVPWEVEQPVVRAYERHAIAECAELLAGLWAYMAERALPMVLAKETAERLDKLFARISRKPQEDTAALMACVRHDALLRELDGRMRRYAKGSGRQNPVETDHPEINAILRYVQQHYDQEISLQAMAQHVNMDENYLSSLFKKKTGDTFINYLQRLRVEEAKFYLEETELAVAEIAERCGFSNPSYFFKIFKRWTGATPNEHRTVRKRETSGSGSGVGL
ncbi:response regulator transcription factor [Cohnella algarum]|uniref:response regulator transcription factor n=1 Tax=Cohnella algarum TaxID=2044859 RepID=UPI001967200B|nr:response regulator [Cohnella algarum]MBN2983682.1 response regulator [Cohnella algarum]